jgi:PPP family 3-phenylpropionic acid transporter
MEVVLMIFAGPWLIRRLGAAGAIGLSGAVGVVRWAAMTADPGLFALWFWQGSHAITFAAAHLGAMAFLGAAAPPKLASTAQGVFGAVAGGVLTAGAMGLAALVYPQAGAGAYWIGAAMSAIGLGFSLWLARRWRGEALTV